MKKFILAILILLLMSTVVCASPHLVCDPSVTPIVKVEVEITYKGVTTVYVGTYIISGPDILLYDLVGFENGSYSFRARWADASEWWSDWSNKLDAVKSGKPGNFRIK